MAFNMKYNDTISPQSVTEIHILIDEDITEVKQLQLKCEKSFCVAQQNEKLSKKL